MKFLCWVVILVLLTGCLGEQLEPESVAYGVGGEIASDTPPPEHYPESPVPSTAPPTTTLPPTTQPPTTQPPTTFPPTTIPPRQPEEVFDSKTIIFLNELETIDSEFDASSFETKKIMIDFWDSISEASTTEIQPLLNSRKAEFQNLFMDINKLSPPAELKSVFMDYSNTIKSRIDAIDIFKDYVIRGVLGSQTTTQYQRRSLEVIATWQSGNENIVNTQNLLNDFYSVNNVLPKPQLVDRVGATLSSQEYTDLIVSLSIDTGGYEFGSYNTRYVDMGETDKFQVNVNAKNTKNSTYNDVSLYCVKRFPDNELTEEMTVQPLYFFDKPKFLGTLEPYTSKSTSFEITLSEYMDGITCYV